MCEHVASSDLDRGSAGDRQGHLGAAVVVEFTHPGAAHHSTVRVGPPLRLPVPETPDVALRTDGG